MLDASWLGELLLLACFSERKPGEQDWPEPDTAGLGLVDRLVTHVMLLPSICPQMRDCCPHSEASSLDPYALAWEKHTSCHGSWKMAHMAGLPAASTSQLGAGCNWPLKRSRRWTVMVCWKNKEASDGEIISLGWEGWDGKCEHTYLYEVEGWEGDPWWKGLVGLYVWNIKCG